MREESERERERGERKKERKRETQTERKREGGRKGERDRQREREKKTKQKRTYCSQSVLGFEPRKFTFTFLSTWQIFPPFPHFPALRRRSVEGSPSADTLLIRSAQE